GNELGSPRPGHAACHLPRRDDPGSGRERDGWWLGVEPSLGVVSLRLRRPLRGGALRPGVRSEEHTSELQSRVDLVCRLLLVQKKKIWQSSAAAQTSSLPPSVATDSSRATTSSTALP